MASSGEDAMETRVTPEWAKSVKSCIEHIQTLIQPETGMSSLDDVLLKKINLSDEHSLGFFPQDDCQVHMTEPLPVVVRFVRLLINRILDLKRLLCEWDDGEKLLSLSQQQTIKSAFEMFFGLGVLPFLEKGLRLETASIQTTVSLPLTQQYCVLLMCVRACMKFWECPIIQSFVVPKHLGDLLAALFTLQLRCEESHSTSKHFLVSSLQEVIENAHQPHVMQHLMLLRGAKECAKRLHKILNRILSSRLASENGMLHLVSTLDGLSDSPKKWKAVETISQLIAFYFVKGVNLRDKLGNQLLLLMSSSDTTCHHVAATTVGFIHETNPSALEFFSCVSQPLTRNASEAEVTKCIETIHIMLGITTMATSRPDPLMFFSHFPSLFSLYMASVDSVSHLKSKIEDIIWDIVTECDLKTIFKVFLFYEPRVDFLLGDSGGFISTKKQPEPAENWLTRMDAFSNLINEKNDSQVKIRLFFSLMEAMKEDRLTNLSAASAKCLGDLAEDTTVIEAVLGDPTQLIDFLKSLLIRETHPSISALGIMVVLEILNDSRHRKRSWEPFKTLIEPLASFREKSDNAEYKFLAEQLRARILSQGILSDEKKSKDFSEFDLAMKEAADPLLPVRAHGLRSLKTLLLKKDAKALAAKDAIFCVFKESLKEEDSYVYLSAVEGLAASCSSFPEETLTILIEQFIATKCEPKVRLTVGEVLVKVTQQLGEMCEAFKHELFGAFFIGCKDEDHLVRASSLSNLGELCKTLAYRVRSHIVEILHCVVSILKTDKEIEPKRASVLVLSQLLTGLQSECFSVLEDEMLPLYRILKDLQLNSPDEITRLHADIALEQLKSSTLSFLSPAPSFEKKIFVLDAPPS